MKMLFILNDPPYGTERCYNALRLAGALAKTEPASQITMFLMADAVVTAKIGRKTPDGYYNIERMLAGKGEILPGTRRSTMDELAAATTAADKVLVF